MERTRAESCSRTIRTSSGGGDCEAPRRGRPGNPRGPGRDLQVVVPVLDRPAGSHRRAARLHVPGHRTLNRHRACVSFGVSAARMSISAIEAGLFVGALSLMVGASFGTAPPAPVRPNVILIVA